MEDTPFLLSPRSIAKDRLDKFLEAKLKGQPDDLAWEFYSFLLIQAQGHDYNLAAYTLPAYQADSAAARTNFAKITTENDELIKLRNSSQADNPERRKL